MRCRPIQLAEETGLAGEYFATDTHRPTMAPKVMWPLMPPYELADIQILTFHPRQMVLRA
jgi:hypothetical protein